MPHPEKKFIRESALIKFTQRLLDLSLMENNLKFLTEINCWKYFHSGQKSLISHVLILQLHQCK